MSERYTPHPSINCFEGTNVEFGVEETAIKKVRNLLRTLLVIASLATLTAGDAYLMNSADSGPIEVSQTSDRPKKKSRKQPKTPKKPKPQTPRFQNKGNRKHRIQWENKFDSGSSIDCHEAKTCFYAKNPKRSELNYT